MLLACNKCPFTIDASDPEAARYFYPKYRDRPLINRSSYSTTCSTCMKAYKKEHYKQNASTYKRKYRERRYGDQYEQILQIEADRRLKNKLAKNQDTGHTLHRRAYKQLDPKSRYIHDRCVSWKGSARHRRLEWKLDPSQILDLLQKQKDLCFYTGLPLVLGPGDEMTLSLDRIDSNLGYIPGNVVLCGTTINLMKHTLDLQTFRHQIELLYRRISIWCPDSSPNA